MARLPKNPAPAEPKAERKKSPKEKAKELRELALVALETILRGDGGDAGKIAAAREVLDRAYGKTRANEKAAARKTVTVVIRRFGESANVIPIRKDRR